MMLMTFFINPSPKILRISKSFIHKNAVIKKVSFFISLQKIIRDKDNKNMLYHHYYRGDIY